MTDRDLKEAIEDKKLPKDKLSNIWDLGLGMSPVTILFFATIVMLLDNDNPVSTKTELILFVITGLLFGIAVYFLLNDRILKSITTDKSKDENRILIIETLKRINWGYQEDSLGIFRVDIPFVFGQAGHFLMIINMNNEVFFNIRNVGTSKGRAPFLFGIDTLKELKFKNELQKTTHNNGA
jgi:hypothetical protein